METFNKKKFIRVKFSRKQKNLILEGLKLRFRDEIPSNYAHRYGNI